jgi:hypothetical protein
MQFDSFEKVFSRMFQQICCNFDYLKDTRGQRGLCLIFVHFISTTGMSEGKILGILDSKFKKNP